MSEYRAKYPNCIYGYTGIFSIGVLQAYRLLKGVLCVLFCPNFPLKLKQMDQLKTYVKFIYIWGDMVSDYTASI